jgi:NAD(P)-dependent dehydrogenase (short-subunit alcohol dehydrogenase family)
MPALEGKVALVTGGGRGLGRAMVRGLIQAGARVVVTAARERAEIDAVVDEAPKGTAAAILADVGREDDCVRAVEQAVKHFGKLDVLINNAGRGMKYVSEDFMTRPTRFWETDPATWRMVIDTNVTGPFLMARAAVPHMLKGGWGRIINTSMSYSTMGRPGFTPYGPSKAALESETRIWAQDLAGTGVTVNAVLPGGATLTGMIPDSFSPAERAKLISPDVMIPMVTWLASNAADGVTGKRFDASLWRIDLSPEEAAKQCARDAGVYEVRA